MSNADLLPSLLFKINLNQLALEAAIMELTLWVERHGAGEVGSLDNKGQSHSSYEPPRALLNYGKHKTRGRPGRC
ncbi:hypothetical protein [Pseudomonas corrugata]|jgi:hypothetical protein|uniref:hypothetical protein n=1 Tax=Pseudomonas corrugata TaxID=47879 RepID=UPI003D8199DD